MAVLIRFVEYGDLLKSREGGEIAKEKFGLLFKIATPSNKIIFDFTNVTNLSSSFADEFFGKLIKEMGFNEFKSITTFKNLNPFVGNVIKNSIYHRNSNNFVMS